jgi:hypothetical protein
MRPAMAVAALCLCMLAPRAYAGEASTALSQCLTTSVSQGDRRALVRWIFSAIAAHPDVAGLAAINAGQREELEKAGAEVFERLIAQDCTSQSRSVLVSEGADGFSAAFKTLGEVAMGGVVEDVQVKTAMAHLGEQLDTQRILKALLSQ